MVLSVDSQRFGCCFRCLNIEGKRTSTSFATQCPGAALGKQKANQLQSWFPCAPNPLFSEVSALRVHRDFQSRSHPAWPWRGYGLVHGVCIGVLCLSWASELSLWKMSSLFLVLCPDHCLGGVKKQKPAVIACMGSQQDLQEGS